MSETLLSSIISSVTALVTVTVTLYFSKSYIERNKKLIQTKNRLADDWIFLYHQEEQLLKEISGTSGKNTDGLKIHYRDKIEKDLGYKLKYLQSTIVKLIEE